VFILPEDELIRLLDPTLVVDALVNIPVLVNIDLFFAILL